MYVLLIDHEGSYIQVFRLGIRLVPGRVLADEIKGLSCAGDNVLGLHITMDDT